MLDTLAPLARELFLTRVAMERSADPQELAEYLGNRVPHRVIPDSHTALEALLNNATTDDVLVVAGSLYLLGEIRPQVQALNHSRKANRQPQNQFS